MDYETYRRNYFVDPQPEQRFQFSGLHGATLFFRDYEKAVGFYTEVLGEPAYVEGSGTRGWKVGETWLTLLAGGTGAPANVEIAFVMDSREGVTALRDAFTDAGAEAGSPTEQLMYVPVFACPVVDPFGTQILIYSVREQVG